MKHGVAVNQSIANETNNSTFNKTFEEGKTIIEALAYILVFITSLIGNTIVVVVVKKNFGGNLRSVSYHFILSLAFSDLAMTIGNVPERITRAFTGDKWMLEGVLGIAICKLVNFIEKMTLVVTISSLTAIALDRFFNVFSPHRIIITSRRSRIVIVLIWTLSAVYCLPILIYGNLLLKNNKTYCKTRIFFPNWTYWFLPFLIILLGSLFIVLVLYFAICVKLWCRKVPGDRQDSSNTQPSARGAVNRKVLKMVAAVVIAYYVCFLPYWLGWIFCSYHFTPLICNKTYSSVSIFLSYVNIALNPIIYVTFSENFREGFKALFNNYCLRRRNRAKVNPIIRPSVDEVLAGMALKSMALDRTSIIRNDESPYSISGV